jgi:RNA polymerase sigma-70 factor (ECF subfamily)
MSVSPTQEITQLLRGWGSGDRQALDRLMALVYDELRHVARRHMALESADHTLQPTALVNEVYLRLGQFPEFRWEDRAHFFAVCAKLMRRILTDSARSRTRLKRGAKAVHVSLDEACAMSEETPVAWVALDDALDTLEALNRRQSQVVELRYFVGLSVDETAALLHVSAETVMRDWKLAKAWILHELSGDQSDGA